MKEYKKLITKGKFSYLWTSQILSQLTVNIINFLIITRLFAVTKSAMATSMLWIAYALPSIFIGPIGAASVDMINKRKVLIVSNILQALTVLSYALLSDKGLFLPYGFAMIYSVINQFNDPAEAATVPALVKKKKLHYANGLFFLTTQGTLVIGYGIAGLLGTSLGFRNTLLLCSALLFIGGIVVSFIPNVKSKDFIPRNVENAVIKFFNRILEGYKYIKNNREVLIPFLLLIGLQVILSITTINVPIIATEIVKINIYSAGIFMVIPAGIGASLGAVLINKFLKKGWRKKQTIETFLVLEIISFLSLAFIIAAIPNTPLRVIASMFTVLIAGIGFVGILIPTQTFLQEKTPGGFRGRVFGNFSFLANIATVFPIIFSGALIEIFSIKLLMFTIAAIIFATLLWSKRFGQRFLENGINK